MCKLPGDAVFDEDSIGDMSNSESKEDWNSVPSLDFFIDICFNDDSSWKSNFCGYECIIPVINLSASLNKNNITGGVGDDSLPCLSSLWPLFDDDDDVYLAKLQTRDVKKSILYMLNVDRPVRHK
jgi:hypothetical protein